MEHVLGSQAASHYDPGIELDLYDRLLMRLLRVQGRLTYAEMARALGISTASARRRTTRLISQGAIFVTAQVQPGAVGYPIGVVVRIRTKPGKQLEVSKTLAAMEEVSYLSSVFGDWDICLEAFLRSPDHLLQFLNRDLGTVSGVEELSTCQVLGVAKLSHLWEGESVGRERLDLSRISGEWANVVAQGPQSAQEGELTLLPWAVEPAAPSVNLDELDRRIVQLLRYDGRGRYSTMARTLGTTEQTLRNRVRRLMDLGALSVIARVNPARVGFPVTVLLFVKVDRGMMRKVGSQIACMDSVSYVGFTTGTTDIYVEANLSGSDGLFEFIDSSFAAVDGVVHSETLRVMRTVKLNHMWEGESDSHRSRSSR